MWICHHCSRSCHLLDVGDQCRTMSSSQHQILTKRCGEFRTSVQFDTPSRGPTAACPGASRLRREQSHHNSILTKYILPECDAQNVLLRFRQRGVPCEVGERSAPSWFGCASTTTMFSASGKAEREDTSSQRPEKGSQGQGKAQKADKRGAAVF